MESVIRAAAVYLFLLLVFRLAGQRTLAQITTFDLVLLLIISEAIQQALIGNDNSMINAALVVLTLAGLNVSGASLTTSETGTSSTFTVTLDSQPTANVTVTLSGLDGTEGGLDRGTLTFDSPEGKALAARVEAMSFDPWHACEDLRPLGAFNRARKVAYFASTTSRGASPEP